MIIRKGIYTFYKGIEMAVTEYYGHGFNQNISKNYRIISYDKAKGVIDGFQLDESNNRFFRSIKITELNNAFCVITKAIYKGSLFLVELDAEIGYIGLKTDNSFVFEKMGLEAYEVNDEKKLREEELYKIKYFKVFDGYIIRVKIEDVEEIWEEKSKSKYDLPIPKGIEKNKTLYRRYPFL